MRYGDHLDSPTNSRDKLGRRQLIKNSLSIGAAGYVAPLIVASTTSVSAGGAPVSSIPCNSPGCVNFQNFGLDVATGSVPANWCGPNFQCRCVSTVDGTACVNPFCSGIGCNTSADCEVGWVCFTQGCCNPGVAAETLFFSKMCIPLCGVSVPPG